MGWKGIVARAQGWVIEDDSSPFADTPVDPPHGPDGDNSEAERKVENPEAPSG